MLEYRFLNIIKFSSIFFHQIIICYKMYFKKCRFLQDIPFCMKEKGLLPFFFFQISSVKCFESFLSITFERKNILMHAWSKVVNFFFLIPLLIFNLMVSFQIYFAWREFFGNNFSRIGLFSVRYACFRCYERVFCCALTDLFSASRWFKIKFINVFILKYIFLS